MTTTFETHGCQVSYQDSGEPSARAAASAVPVVLLHGWGASADTMRSIYDALSPTHRVVALDFPGFGRSSPPPGAWGVGQYRDLVLAWLDSLGIQRCAIIGHSFGGRVGIRIAAEQPERVSQLVLVDSAGIRPIPTLQQSILRAAARGARLVLSAPGLGALRGQAEETARARFGSTDYQSAGPLRETFVKVVNEDLQPYLPRIAAPTLLVWGELDDATPLADARLMEKLIPDAGLVVFAGAGHFSYLDRPAEFARVVRTFLATPA